MKIKKHVLSLSFLVVLLSMPIFGQVTVQLDVEVDNSLSWHATNTATANTVYGTVSYIRAEDWTSSGLEYKHRQLFKFDVSHIPENAVVTDATLYLYASPNHYHSLGNSECNLKRVTSDWNGSIVTWNNFDPNISTTNQNAVDVPAATSAQEDYEIVVTDIVQEWVSGTAPNYGFFLGLDTEATYRRLYFVSSDYSDETKHPKLVITYQFTEAPDKEGFETTNTRWGNVDGEDIDWTRNIGSTTSSSTGPSSAADGSYYMYIESSYNGTGYPNKQGILLSPSYYLSDALSPSISFDYHMYGQYMGSLDLEITTDGGTTWNSIWSKSGNQGNEWYNALIDLSSYIGNLVQFRFVGVTSTSWTSDMALDDIRVYATVEAQVSENENYIYTITPLSQNGISGPMLQNVQYYDGLGRLFEEINVAASPLQNDMIKPVKYNESGKIERDYLAFTAADNGFGRFRDFEITGDDVIEMQNTFFRDHFAISDPDAYAYARTVHEESPLNRVLEQGGPGEEWQPIEETGGTVENVQKIEYGTNISNDIYNFTVDASGNLNDNPDYYSSNELFKTTSYDEEGNQVDEYIDKLGQVILKRNWEGSTKYSTYYVYDDFGLLRYVLPPLSGADSGKPSSDIIDALCYKYTYDQRRRMVEKILPGVDEEVSMVYDIRDRLVAIQDGNLREDSKWLITKYDYLNRPVITALFSSELIRFDLQTTVNSFSCLEEEYNGSASFFGYDNQGWPVITDTSTVQTVTYYDNYDFSSLTEFSGMSIDQTNNIDKYQDNDGSINGYFDRVSGMVTATSTRVLDNPNPQWVHNINYYDDRYRLIQTQGKLYPNGEVMTSTQYDFSGNVIGTLEMQEVNSVPNKLQYLFTYDHVNRPRETYVIVNDENILLLASNEYNELGELIEKNLHKDGTADFIQSVDYSYNIRGWLTSINDVSDLTSESDHFAMSLYYSEDISGNTGLFNGNISALTWTRPGDNGTINGYKFEYDDLNRITKADFGLNTGSGWNATSDNFDSEYSYDSNGNFLTLKRNNSTGILVDNLDYTYKNNQYSNQILTVNDLANSNELFDDRSQTGQFVYDDNGNMESDPYKGISIDYNYLNLPEKIQTQISPGTDNIEYIYDASGVKLLKKISNGATQNVAYNGSFVYLFDDSSGFYELDYVLSPEGRIDFNDQGTINFRYALKDHLGNTRVEFDVASTNNQNTDYYPFGMTAWQSTSGNDNKYLYNGKELQDELLGSVNLDWYDYGARFYDPALGRWHVPDPLAEYHFNMTPYHYVYNNPMRFIDPFGLEGNDPIYIGGEIPEVEIVYTAPSPPDNSWHSNFVQFMWQIEYGMYGNSDYSRNRDATAYDNFVIKHFDQSEVNNIGEAASYAAEKNTGTDGLNRNTVNSDASYEGRYPQNDKDEYENATGPSKAASPASKTIVKTYTKTDSLRVPPGWRNATKNIHGEPASVGDTTHRMDYYITDGVVDSVVINNQGETHTDYEN